jgi:hypothetical protein
LLSQCEALNNDSQGFDMPQTDRIAPSFAKPMNVTPPFPAAAGGIERRASRRNPVIKSARLVFTEVGAVHDCLVLDESLGGVLVDLGAMIQVPAEVTIQFTNGASYLAQRRWAVGTKAGLSFSGGQVISNETAKRMRAVAEILRNQGLPAAMSTLRAARFFDHGELRRAAEDAEAAFARFERAIDEPGPSI